MKMFWFDNPNNKVDRIKKAPPLFGMILCDPDKEIAIYVRSKTERRTPSSYSRRKDQYRTTSLLLNHLNYTIQSQKLLPLVLFNLFQLHWF